MFSLSFLTFLLNVLGVTLINKIIQVSGTQCYDTSPAWKALFFRAYTYLCWCSRNLRPQHTAAPTEDHGGCACVSPAGFPGFTWHSACWRPLILSWLALCCLPHPAPVLTGQRAPTTVPVPALLRNHVPSKSSWGPKRN